MLSGLNHITITVKDIDQSLDFYTETLGFKAHVRWDSGAYLTVGSLWFCLSLGSPCKGKDYSHIALTIPAAQFEPFCGSVRAKNVKEWKANRSEGDSLYILDPDGHKLEIHVGSLNSRLESLKTKPYSGLKWL